MLTVKYRFEQCMYASSHMNAHVGFALFESSQI